jgi:hypothetical protein
MNTLLTVSKVDFFTDFSREQIRLYDSVEDRKTAPGGLGKRMYARRTWGCYCTEDQFWDSATKPEKE